MISKWNTFFSAYEYTVPAHGKALIKTDLKFAVPEGCYGRVAPRSGLALNHFIDVGAGVIDADYRYALKFAKFENQISKCICFTEEKLE